MKSKTLTYTIAMVVLGALPISVRLSAQEDKDDHRHGHEPKLIEFDAPGAGTGQGFGTVALSINPAGAITGYHNDANGMFHGFLRARDGTITTFDPPGSVGTTPGSINPAGAIAGFYVDASFVPHGFLRARDGTVTTFDPPGVGTFAFATDINQAGAVTGYSYDASGTIHGFLRSPGEGERGPRSVTILLCLPQAISCQR